MKERFLIIMLMTLLFSCNMKTDKNVVKDWTYKIDSRIVKTTDTIKPIGRIEFQRTKAIIDKKRKEIYETDWFPSIGFDIFNLSDLEFCEQQSLRTKRLASCIPPNVGGDLIIVQDYIFLNRSVCLNCIGTEDKVDYCRPIVKKILSDLNLTGTKNLMEVDEKIGMRIKRTE